MFFDTLNDTCGFATTIAQIVEFSATNLTASYDFDRIDHRGVEGEDALDPFPVGNFADTKALVNTTTVAGDTNAFIGLYTGFIPLHQLDIDDERIAGLKRGDC